VENGDVPPEIDTSKPHSARIYDYYLGGKDNFAADRETAVKAMKAWPPIRMAARENRAFLGRAVRYLAEEAGITQFLDLGSGLPGVGNVHEIAQDVNRAARVVYVDNDPIVLAHARALLTSTPDGACDYIEADLREPRAILDQAANTLDFGRPVAVMLLMTLQYIPDADDPHHIVSALLDAVPPGSYLAVSDVARDLAADANVETSTERLNERMGPARMTIRGVDQIAGFFGGLEMVPPGLVQLPQWRPELGVAVPVPGGTISAYCGVGRKL
jgi:SAM-dependent methyltransferase